MKGGLTRSFVLGIVVLILLAMVPVSSAQGDDWPAYYIYTNVHWSSPCDTLWYEVFVGGPHTGFVPASKLELHGPLPE